MTDPTHALEALIRTTLGSPGFMGAMVSAFALRARHSDDWDAACRDKDVAKELADAAPEIVRAILQQPVEGWRTIDSAPKDGREILMHYGLGTGDVPPPLVVAWSKADSFWYAVGFDVEVTTEPSHWRPLPDPPVLGATGGRS